MKEGWFRCSPSCPALDSSKSQMRSASVILHPLHPLGTHIPHPPPTVIFLGARGPWDRRPGSLPFREGLDWGLTLTWGLDPEPGKSLRTWKENPQALIHSPPHPVLPGIKLGQVNPLGTVGWPLPGNEDPGVDGGPGTPGSPEPSNRALKPLKSQGDGPGSASQWAPWLLHGCCSWACRLSLATVSTGGVGGKMWTQDPGRGPALLIPSSHLSSANSSADPIGDS